MEKRGLRPEDLYQLKTVGEADVSSDGQLLVYVVKTVDEKLDRDLTDLYLLDLQTRVTKRLTGSGKDHSPRFSPDGQRIAFVSDRSDKAQIWVLELAGGEAWQLPTKEAVSGTPCWFPDGRQIAYQASVFPHAADWTPYPGAPTGDADRLRQIAEQPPKEPVKDEQKPNLVKVITRLRYRGDGVGYYGQKRKQVFVTPVPQQAAFTELAPAGKQITAGDYDFGAPTISPDSRYLVTSARQSEQADYELQSDLWLYTLASGEASLLYQGPGPVSQPLWCPSADVLAFLGHDNQHNVSTTIDLWLLGIGDWLAELERGQRPAPLTADAAQNVTKPLDRAVGAHAGSELRHGGSTAFWASEQLFFVLSDQGAGGIYSVDTAGQMQTLLKDPGQSVTSIAGNGEALVYVSSAPDRPEELFLWQPGKSSQLSAVNAEFLAGIALGPWERIAYQSADGQAIDGWVIYPVDYQPGRRYPTLLLVHGGPHGAYGPAFMFAGQIFSGQGYLVLFTNPRGSTTYGQEFTRAIDKNWGVVDYADLMAGVDHVVAAGWADPEQLFLHGWSFGGYMTCWMVTQTDRFRAACGGASVTNLLSDYGTSDILWADEWEYGGKPWQDGLHLLQHSPLSHVAEVKTPLLLLHGEGDLRVPISQSEEFYAALKRLGKTAVLVRYPGEYHGLRRPLHRVDRYHRLLSWFAYYRQN